MSKKYTWEELTDISGQTQFYGSLYPMQIDDLGDMGALDADQAEELFGYLQDAAKMMFRDMVLDNSGLTMAERADNEWAFYTPRVVYDGEMDMIEWNVRIIAISPIPPDEQHPHEDCWNLSVDAILSAYMDEDHESWTKWLDDDDQARALELTELM